ncbi:MAG: hypothetical protein WA628_07500 [Terriglobales bacterium]
MDINDIKPPGGSDPYAGSDEQPVEGTRDRRFPESKSRLEASEPAEVTGPSLGVVTQFHKTALEDPAKLDTMVRASVSELIDSGQNITGHLSGVEKQSLVDFLSADPVVRRQVENYLRKALV